MPDIEPYNNKPRGLESLDHAVTPEATPGVCFKAAVLRAAYDIPPADIPENFDYRDFEGYRCSVVGEDEVGCKFANPIVFLRRDIGFTAMGSSGFCRLEGESPGEFKKASRGNMAVRVARFGKAVAAGLKNRSSK